MLSDHTLTSKLPYSVFGEAFIAPDQAYDAALQGKLQRVLRKSVKKYTSVYS